MTDDLVKRLRALADYGTVHEAADRIEQLEAALKKIATIEDEHINAPRTNAEANLWAILAVCVDLADEALAGEKKDD